MKYIALLRGINVGGNHKVEMKRLKAFFESLGCSNVTTYINSGNVIFELKNDQNHVLKEFDNELKKEFEFEIPTLIKTVNEIKKIADAIPKEWQNDLTHKTDVAYLFPEIDSKEILDDLPVKKEYIDIRYVKGAVYWNIERKNYNKSHLNKIIRHKLYQFMTVRNVNTARHLAEQK
jgi:uncharacterized protein (DUF1697 family)